MNLMKKIEILSDSAKYDVSCASSGVSRKGYKGFSSGVCHSWSDDGRCISLLKTLFTNICVFDCAYCVNRRSNDILRVSFTPRELAELTVEFYKRNYVEGLFLSSGIVRNSDYTMELMVETLRILRGEFAFRGYVHVKAIPGASEDLIDMAGALADRISINVELPSEKSLNFLTDKTRRDIFRPMESISRKIVYSAEEKRKYRSAPNFAVAGQSTQMIVGATPETDLSIVKLSEAMYNKFSLRRVYYSAFIPVNPNEKKLPEVETPPFLREHRLYQADFLLRRYNFTADEILSGKKPMLDTSLDPKANWALDNFHLFPVEINKADYEMLLRVPGIGPLSARRIIRGRRSHKLDFPHLKQMGAVIKRACYFITCRGRKMPGVSEKYTEIYNAVSENRNNMPQQLDIFDIK